MPCTGARYCTTVSAMKYSERAKIPATPKTINTNYYYTSYTHDYNIDLPHFFNILVHTTRIDRPYLVILLVSRSS